VCHAPIERVGQRADSDRLLGRALLSAFVAALLAVAGLVAGRRQDRSPGHLGERRQLQHRRRRYGAARDTSAQDGCS
jgi:hypothetical protein